MNKLAVIVPVYGDWESLEQNIRALLKYAPKSDDITIHYVNDCGPEVHYLEKNITKLISSRDNFYYHRNEKNIGFVQSCNNAVFNFAQRTADVLLLNSDAVITKGLLEEMREVLYLDDRIAAVCPRSNSATIFSVPMRPKPGVTYTMKRSYRIYKRIRRKLPRYYDSPLAHGFCMMIRRSVIDEIGLFDEIYGKGYGEENDFCMRALHHGYTCAVANHAYAFHYKARSFSEERRSEQVAVNEKILDERYPEFRQLIRDYLERTHEPR